MVLESSHVGCNRAGWTVITVVLSARLLLAGTSCGTCRPFMQRFTNEPRGNIGQTAQCYTESRHECSWRVIRHKHLDTHSYHNGECCLHYHSIGDATWDDVDIAQTADIPEFLRLESGNCPEEFVDLGKSCYKFVVTGTRVTWAAAMAECENLNASLFVMDTQEEQTILFAYVDSNNPEGNVNAWTALKDVDNTLTYVDMSDGEGRVPTHLPWHAAYGSDPDKDCVVAWSDSSFNIFDSDCGETQIWNYICEAKKICS